MSGSGEGVHPLPMSRMRWAWDRRALILVCGLATVLRLAIAIPLHSVGFTSDEKEYLFLANKILSQQTFEDSNGEWSVKPPAFPAFLAAMFWVFGRTLAPLLLINAILGGTAVAVGFAIVNRVTGNLIAAWWTAGMLALHPSFVIYGAVLQSEALYIVLLLAAVLVAVRMVHKPSLRASALLGVFLVGAILTRAIGLGVAMALFAALLLAMDAPWQKRVGTIAVACLIMIIGLAPWTVRNYSIHHAFVPVSTFAGTSLLLGNNPYSNGTMALPPEFQDWVRNEAARRGLPDPERMTEIDREHVQEQIAVGWITAHPAGWARLLLKKLHVFWIYPVTTTANSHPIQAIALSGDLFLWVGALAGFFALYDKRRELLPVVAVIVMVTAAHVAMHAEARYRLPLVALVSIFFGPGMAAIVGQREVFQRKGPVRVAAMGLAVLLLLGYAYAGMMFLHGEV